MTESAKNAAEKLDKMAKGAEDLQKAGNKLTAVQDLIKGSKSFGKIAKGLGAISAGLGAGLAIADMFGAFGPSVETQILAGLTRIEGKIDKLEQTMLTEFDKLTTQLKVESAKIQLAIDLPYLTALHDQVTDYKALLKTKSYGDIDQAEKDLLKEAAKANVYKSVHSIYEQMLGLNYSTPLLPNLYKHSYGDMEAVTDFARHIMQYVTFGMHAYVLLNTIELRRGANSKYLDGIEGDKARVTYKRPGFTPQEMSKIAGAAQRKFSWMIEKIASELERQINKGIQERKANATAYVTAEVLGKTYSSDLAKGREENSFTPKFTNKWLQLPNKLQRMYLCDWLVIVHGKVTNKSHDQFFKVKCDEDTMIRLNSVTDVDQRLEIDVVLKFSNESTRPPYRQFSISPNPKSSVGKFPTQTPSDRYLPIPSKTQLDDNYFPSIIMNSVVTWLHLNTVRKGATDRMKDGLVAGLTMLSSELARCMAPPVRYISNVRGEAWGDYLIVKTTSPSRMVMARGKGRMFVVYR